MATQSEHPLGPKRILVVADPRGPFTQQGGLVGCKGGHEVYWYSTRKTEVEGLSGVITPPLGRLGQLSILYSPLFLKRAIHRIQPDLIHAFFAFQKFDTFVLAHFRPLILTVLGGDILPDQMFRGAWTWLVKKMLDSADIITSKSSFLDEALNRIGDYAHKIRRVTFGVDTKKFQPSLDVSVLQRRWNIDPDDLVFFSPRICHPFYKQDLIIRAFAGYLQRAQKGVKAKLIVAELFPDEAYCRHLRRLVAELRLTQSVRFVGAIPYQEIPAYFNLADIMIATPPSDGMPHSLYEAMACGTYPILGNLPPYQELLKDSINGRLVPVGDINALAEAMHWAAAHPEQRKAAAVINRQRIIEMADKDGQDRLVNSIYDELCQKYAK